MAPAGIAFSNLSMSNHHGCGVTEPYGDVICWGEDFYGETVVPFGL
jgi:hypothetical protein